MKLKKLSAAALAALTVTMMSAVPVLAADDIEVNEDISVSGDYDWTRFTGDHITLNVYNNGLYISDGSDDSVNVLSAFEDLTGIKVNYTTYDSNESLYAKLKSGGVSYDVIFPSDYMVGKMAKEGMLSELNMDNIPNFAGIGETYLDRSFDPGNKYSVPYMWGTTGLIYNTTMVEEPPTKWADMWDVAYTNNVLMFNNSRDAYAIAAKTIGLSMNPQSVDEITAITDALKAQKNIVQAYVMDEVFDKMEGGEAAMAPYYAGVIAMRPDCLVLDESTAMLDPHGRSQVMKTIRQLREAGITIVSITHYMEEAAQADRVLVMSRGRIVMEGTPEQVFSQTERLHSYHLDVPQAAELRDELVKLGIPMPENVITPEACAEELFKLLK